MSDNHGGLYNLISAHEKRIAEQQARIEALEEVPAIVCVVAALQAYGYTIPSGWVLPTTHKSPYWEQCWRKALLEGE